MYKCNARIIYAIRYLQSGTDKSFAIHAIGNEPPFMQVPHGYLTEPGIHVDRERGGKDIALLRISARIFTVFCTARLPASLGPDPPLSF